MESEQVDGGFTLTRGGFSSMVNGGLFDSTMAVIRSNAILIIVILLIVLWAQAGYPGVNMSSKKPDSDSEKSEGSTFLSRLAGRVGENRYPYARSFN